MILHGNAIEIITFLHFGNQQIRILYACVEEYQIIIILSAAAWF